MDMKYGKEKTNCIGMIPNPILTLYFSPALIPITNTFIQISSTIEFRPRK